jgi:hypothetical protein
MDLSKTGDKVFGIVFIPKTDLLKMGFAEILRFFNWDQFVQKLSESASNSTKI